MFVLHVWLRPYGIGCLCRLQFSASSLVIGQPLCMICHVCAVAPSHHQVINAAGSGPASTVYVQCPAPPTTSTTNIVIINNYYYYYNYYYIYPSLFYTPPRSCGYGNYYGSSFGNNFGSGRCNLRRNNGFGGSGLFNGGLAGLTDILGVGSGLLGNSFGNTIGRVGRGIINGVTNGVTNSWGSGSWFPGLVSPTTNRNQGELQ